MTKLLNLNQLSAKEVREVKIGETTYAIKEMSVEDFIETSRVAEEMENETSYAKQLQATIGLVKRAIPNIEASALLGLSIEQLKGLTAFIRGEDAETIVGAAQKDAQSGTEGEQGNG